MVEKGKKIEVTRLPTVYVGKMVARKDEVLEELKNLIISRRKRALGCVDEEFEKITEMLCDVTKQCLVPLGDAVPEVIEWQSRYDLVKWIREDYQRPLSEYCMNQLADVHLVMNNFTQTRMTNEIISGMDDENVRMQYYLRNTNSSNVRRRLVYATDTSQTVEMHLLNLEGFADAAHSVRPEDFPS